MNDLTMPKLDFPRVGLRIECLRMALGISRREFAESFGLDPSSYTKTASGEKPLKSEHAYIISERWGVSMDYIYRGRLTDLPDNLSAAILANLKAQ